MKYQVATVSGVYESETWDYRSKVEAVRKFEETKVALKDDMQDYERKSVFLFNEDDNLLMSCIFVKDGEEVDERNYVSSSFDDYE